MITSELAATVENKKRRPPRRAKLTKSTIENIPLPPAGKREYLWDIELPGFGVMIMSSGVRSYLIQYTIGGRQGKPTRYTIGHHGKPWTLDKARALAREKLMMVKSGIDPNGENRQRLKEDTHRRQLVEDLNFGTLAVAFLKAKSQLRKTKEDRSLFDRILIPRWGHLPVTNIRRDDVHAMVDDLADRSEAAANKAFARLKAFLNWVSEKKESLYPVSPIVRMKLPFADGKRTRFLEGPEIRYLWMAAETLPKPIEACIKLLILTGLRLREVASAHWREINLDTREWVIPAERMKNKKPHLVPLTDCMISILTELGPKPAHRRGYVMTLNGETPLNSFSKTKELLNAALARIVTNEFKKNDALLPEPSTLADWVYHDLRRTLSTHLVRVGTPITHTEAILSHALPGVGKVSEHYIIYNFSSEKRQGLEQWGKLVTQYVEDASAFEAPVIPYDGQTDEDGAELVGMEQAP